jgi:hypothetical protein
MTYENIFVDEDYGADEIEFVFKGSTFGCSCCSTTEEIPADKAVKELLTVAEMYISKGERYVKMANFARKYDLPAVRKIWNEYKNAQDRVDGAYQWLNEPAKCGTWQKELYENFGIDSLEATLEGLEEGIEPYMREVAEAFGWR